MSFTIPHTSSVWSSVPIPARQQQPQSVKLVAPESKATTSHSVPDALAVFGNAANFAIGGILLFLPLIHKRADKVVDALLKARTSLTRWPVSPNAGKALRGILSDRPRFEKYVKSASMASIFLQGINLYQTAVNTKQPSLVTSALLRDAVSLGTTFFPTDTMYSLFPFTAVFNGAGKYNDINNTNHAEQRHDWDFRRLTCYLPFHAKHGKEPQRDFKTEFSGFKRFVMHDLKNALSLKHWKTLKTFVRHPETWGTPQPFQSALSAQTALGLGITSLASVMTKKKVFSYASAVLVMATESLSVLPLFVRGWQHRREKDGLMVAVGSPLIAFSSVFQPQIFPKLFFLSSLGAFGGTFNTRGLALNSKKYLAFTEELQWLHNQAKQNPSLTASDVLRSLEQSPSDMALLNKRLGKARFDELIGILHSAKQSELKHVSLEKSLAPVAASFNQ